MLIETAKRLWGFKPDLPERTAFDEAEHLIAVWGEAAYMVAAERSHQDGLGFPSPVARDHWSRVKHEIGQRHGWNVH